MLSITHHEGDANQNHNELSPHTFRMATIKKTRNNKYWQGYGKRQSLYTVLRNVNWIWRGGKTVYMLLKN